MKILVLTKRVEDPETKIKIKPDKSGIQTEGMKYALNPFDEIAVEEALRVRDSLTGEVVVVLVGVEDAQAQIRTALAMGADRGIHVTGAAALDPHTASEALAHVIRAEKADLVLMGKQAVDDDMGQTGALLAEKLGFAQATAASKEASLESDDEKNKKTALLIKDGRAEVVREVDGGIETLSVALPAVVTCELRLNIPRYASLPNIMKAKKKEIRSLPLADALAGATPWVRVVSLDAPAQRSQGAMVPDVATLVSKLKQEAKVL